MKRNIIFYLLAGITAAGHAQNADKEVELQQVEVKAARVINKADGRLLYPTEQQKSASSTGYGILQKLALPNIRIDDTECSVVAVDNSGSVQLRINGIEAGKSEMLALDPNTITKIDFIDNPGVRYGEGVAYVIDIHTRRSDKGYSIGADITQGITAMKGTDMVYGKWNTGKSEFSISYDFGYKHLKGDRMQETARYTLNDGSVRTIVRNDEASLNRIFSNDIQLKYNRADSGSYVFQAVLDIDLMNMPGNYNRKHIADGTTGYTATEKDKGHSTAPTLDLYYHRRLTERQTVTVNAVGTYIGTSSHNSYDEGTPYIYNVSGTTCSLMGEAIYENRLKPFVLSAGLNFKQKYTCNEYTGDVSSTTPMHNTALYAFTEIKGSLGRLRYSAGMGFNYLHYSQHEHEYNFRLLRPKLSAVYGFNSGLQLNYDIEVDNHVSKIAMISDATMRNNSMEWTVGNPDIRPNSVLENTLRLSYNKDRWQAYIQGFYRINRHPNMARYERTDDNRFIYTQCNQKEIDALHLMAYTNCWIIPQKLSVMAYGGMFRCLNFGNDYTHCYTSWFGTASVNAYIGALTLTAYTDSGWRFMEGETKAYNGSYTSLKAQYRHNNWQLSITWMQPFCHNKRMFESELCSRYIGKTNTLRSTDMSNFLSLNISWRLNKGRKYQAADKTINLKDNETGIIK